MAIGVPSPQSRQLSDETKLEPLPSVRYVIFLPPTYQASPILPFGRSETPTA